MSLSSVERQNQIVQLLFQNQRISVAEICTTFEISKATACRDLEALVSSKKIQRVHGGALPLAYSSPEIPMLIRREEQAETKRRIGQAAAELVRDGDTIVLGSGSTVLQAARNLKEHRNLTVITNSLPVMNLMVERSDISLVSIGGMLLPTELCFIGHIAELALEEVRADKAIIGVHSINLEQGLTSDYLPEAMTDRALLRAARETIVVADHTKFGRISAALLVPVEKIQTIVTDAETPKDFISGLQDRGIRVIVA
ncbi:MAG: DeoR/GlpR family DNA-binding transcription regulator [Anaerolineales bacterium]|jgi:DeoR/GlpR family transcriptional regulator of sugar metabolism